MRIRITKDFTSPGLSWALGDTPDVSPKMAEGLIRSGVAEPLEELPGVAEFFDPPLGPPSTDVSTDGLPELDVPDELHGTRREED